MLNLNHIQGAKNFEQDYSSTGSPLHNPFQCFAEFYFIPLVPWTLALDQNVLSKPQPRCRKPWARVFLNWVASPQSILSYLSSKPENETDLVDICNLFTESQLYVGAKSSEQECSSTGPPLHNPDLQHMLWSLGQACCNPMWTHFLLTLHKVCLLV